MSLNTLTKILIIGVAHSLMLGCASTSSKTPAIKEVSGTEFDVAQLTGTWEGNFSSTVSQRSGTITLELNQAGKREVGSILLQYQKQHPKVHAPKGHNVKKTGTYTKTKPLSVEFIAIEGGKISGNVTPYADPVFTRKTVFTTYEGIVTGNRIEGTYTTRVGQNGNSFTGSWWAVRK